ncbi:MAG: hypothetical protein ACK56F_24700, partial [bacterium]
IRDKVRSLLFGKKDKNEAQKKRKKKSKWLSKIGIDTENLQKTIKKDAVSLMLFGNFKLDRLRYSNIYETSLM